MSFDIDPNEQASISGADLAIMCDEIKSITQQRDELLAALKKLIDKEFAYVDNKLAGGQIDMYDVWDARSLVSKIECKSDA